MRICWSRRDCLRMMTLENSQQPLDSFNASSSPPLLPEFLGLSYKIGDTTNCGMYRIDTQGLFLFHFPSTFIFP